MSVASHRELWLDASRTRYFLVPESAELEPGTFAVYNLSGECRCGDEPCLRLFEINEAAALGAVRADLSTTLDELKQGLDTGLRDLHASLVASGSLVVGGTPAYWAQASSAMLEFCKRLPCVVAGSLSGEPRRIDAARVEMREMHRQFMCAGIRIESAFTDFPSRLAQLRADFDARRRK